MHDESLLGGGMVDLSASTKASFKNSSKEIFDWELASVVAGGDVAPRWHFGTSKS